jgi:hypothetical protein
MSNNLISRHKTFFHASLAENSAHHHDTSSREVNQIPFPVCTYNIGGKAAKLDPVKRQPPTSRRFYFKALPCLLVYVFVSSHILTNVANAASVAGYLRYPSCRFVFSSATPTASPGLACLALPGCHQFQLRPELTQIIGLHLLGRPAQRSEDDNGNQSRSPALYRAHKVA